ncbi:MAG: hypothetical protein JNM00_04715 [Flavobacteriales bacterium]|nr:hypothetical protein [Flavobacteriales bacterium]
MKGLISLSLLLVTVGSLCQRPQVGNVLLGLKVPVSLTPANTVFPFTAGVGPSLGVERFLFKKYSMEGGAEFQRLFSGNAQMKTFTYASAWLGFGIRPLSLAGKWGIHVGGMRTLATFVPEALSEGAEPPPRSMWINNAPYLRIQYQLTSRFTLDLRYARSIPNTWDKNNFYSMVIFGIGYQFPFSRGVLYYDKHEEGEKPTR